MRRLGVVAGGLALVVVGVYAAGEWYQTRDYLPWFLEHKGELVSFRETPIEAGTSHTTWLVELRDDRGLTVEAHLRVPNECERALPVVVILGGLGTGKRTVEYLGDSAAMLVAIDYPYKGKRRGLSYWEFVRGLPAMRRAILNTPPAVMLVVDYLWQRDDVDHDRVLLAGGSFGALFAPAAAAAEPRVSALAIFFGAGELDGLIRANFDFPSPGRQILSWIGASIVSPMEPLKYIGHVAPRPVFMLNGSEDRVMPERNTRLLHDAAGEPKTIVSVPLGHVNVRSTEFQQLILDHLLEWLIEIGFVPPEEAGSFLQLED